MTTRPKPELPPAARAVIESVAIAFEEDGLTERVFAKAWTELEAMLGGRELTAAGQELGKLGCAEWLRAMALRTIGRRLKDPVDLAFEREPEPDAVPQQLSEGEPKRKTAKMRRAFDDLDPVIYREKRWRRHRRQRFVRFLRKVAGLCASCGEKLSRDNDGVTCPRCLGVDKDYKTESADRARTAAFVDERGRPMRLKGTPRMLPVIGPRHDGDGPDWPVCENLSACMTELVLACGAKEAPGASCPEGCSHFVDATPPGHVRIGVASAYR